MSSKQAKASNWSASGTRFELVEKPPARGATASGAFIVLKPKNKPDSFTLKELKRAVRSVVHSHAKT